MSDAVLITILAIAIIIWQISAYYRFKALDRKIDRLQRQMKYNDQYWTTQFTETMQALHNLWVKTSESESDQKARDE